ncbi:MAG: cytochrome P450 [Nitriliruptoraceae bacterium]|nr:cytochrome P450 [Nitriliruptoraceae bacterium]
MEPDPFDPFRADRRATGVAEIHVAGERLAAVLRFADVKAAAHDWATFSSDAPFRVPIPQEQDVRAVRQLPIESDPPQHRTYRRVVREPFGRAAADRLAGPLAEVVDDLLDDVLAEGRVEVVRGFALPLQSRALALLLGRPLGDAEEWIGWGTHVFRDPDGAEGGALDAYLDRVLDDAVADPGPDLFGSLATAELDGRRLTREEMTGFANLVFAGGRDTVINLVTNALAHLAAHPDVLARLRTEPGLIRSATEEYLRYYSPLTHIGRVAVEPTAVHGCPVAQGGRIALGFAAANRDEEVFDRADECLVDRWPNRHLAFGHGPHTCLGAPLTRGVMAALLGRLTARVGHVTILEAEPMYEELGGRRRQLGYGRLLVEVGP